MKSATPMAEPPALLPCDRLGASPAVGWVVAGCAVVWLWIQYCRFPLSAWNDVRLVPVFMMMAGEPVYTLPGEGVLTTWM